MIQNGLGSDLGHESPPIVLDRTHRGQGEYQTPPFLLESEVLEMAKVGEVLQPLVQAVLQCAPCSGSCCRFQSSARSEAPILREPFRGLAMRLAEFLPCEVMGFMVQIPGLYPRQGQRYSKPWSAMSFPSWTAAFALPLPSSPGLLRG